MSSADLYINSIDFSKYLNINKCSECGFPSCADFIEAVKKDTGLIEACVFIDRNRHYAFEAVRKVEALWPDVPLITLPRPAFTGLVGLNNPDESSLVLVTGNNEFTEQVLLTVLGTTACPFHVLFIDTDGNTVDMSMIFNTFNAERILNALKKTDLYNNSVPMNIVIPGLAHTIENELKTLTQWNVRTGPVCAAELPLFLADIWIQP